MLKRTYSILPVTLAAALAVACSEAPEKTGRVPTSPPGRQVTAPVPPKDKACPSLPAWGRYWLT